MTEKVVTRYGRCMRLVDITPELAERWLATLPGAGWPNGHIDHDKVRRYSHAMRAGTWQLLQLPIVVRNGRLLSSRHRLAAVIDAGMTVTMYVSDETAMELAKRR